MCGLQISPTHICRAFHYWCSFFFFFASVTPGLCDNAIKLELEKISYLLSVPGGSVCGERGRTGPKQEMSALVLSSWWNSVQEGWCDLQGRPFVGECVLLGCWWRTACWGHQWEQEEGKAGRRGLGKGDWGGDTARSLGFADVTEIQGKSFCSTSFSFLHFVSLILVFDRVIYWVQDFYHN